MDVELHEKLEKDFGFYKGYYGKGCEISCGDGWFNLIYELSIKLKELCEKQNFELQVIQVKEKFGTLRYYIASGTDEIFELIERYEKLSETICENDGLPGILHSKFGWYRTVCSQCLKEWEKRWK